MPASIARQRIIQTTVILSILAIILLPLSSRAFSDSATITSQSSSSSPFKYLVTIVEENQPLNASIGILGNTADAPFINGLLPQAALATNYHDTSHDGSLSQYVGMISGNNRCFDNSPDPKGGNPCQLSGNTIVDRIEASGRTWKAYMEDYRNCYTSQNKTGCNPQGCFTDLYLNEGQYLGNHNPFLYFPSITSSYSRCANIVPANSVFAGYTKFEAYPDLLLSDLNSSNTANYNWLVPNHCDSFHGPFGPPSNWSCDPYYCNNMTTNSAQCLHNQIEAGDKYLSKVVPRILNTVHFQAGEAALFITFDEPNSHPDRSPGCSNPRYVPKSSDECPILGLWIGPTVKAGFRSDLFYSHYSYLRTIEDAWQLSPLTVNDTNASPMTEFFTSQFPTPIAMFTVGPPNPLVGQTVTFTSSMVGGTGSLTSSWDFGDGTPLTGPTSSSTATHVYAKNGTFTVRVTVTDSIGHTDTSTQSLPVALAVMASFDYSPVNVAPGIAVDFVPQVTGGLGTYSYSWNFGDDNTDMGPSPSHKYTEAGIYMVGLKVSDQLQHSRTYNKTVLVSPMAGLITIDTAAPFAGDGIRFATTVFGGTGPYILSWNFGDGGIGTGNLTSHTYATEGVYRVRVNITDSSTLFAESLRDLTVLRGLCAAPRPCSFSTDISSPTASQKVVFTATPDGGSAPYILTWYFGDGDTATGASVQHAYHSSGTYNVRLVVKDSVGHSYETASILTVRQPSALAGFYSPILLVAFASGAVISGVLFWYRSRILGWIRFMTKNR